jgi:hypothetical protein
MSSNPASVTPSKERKAVKKFGSADGMTRHESEHRQKDQQRVTSPPHAEPADPTDRSLGFDLKNVRRPINASSQQA